MSRQISLWKVSAGAAVSILLAAPVCGQVSIRFDAGQTVACHEVFDEEFLQAHPGERLWEAKLEVSSLIVGGSEENLVHYFYRLDALQPQTRIVDYLPKTTLGSEFSGDVQIERKEEQDRSLGLAITGKFDSLLAVTPTAGVGSKNSSRVQYSLLPPKEQVSAAGTLRRGRGVYFKLRPSSQQTLEGGKEFAVVFRAPQSWRGGLALLRCEAVGLRRGLVRSLDERQRAGQAVFVLALYRAGDGEAQAAAEGYAETESRLRRLAAQNRTAIERESLPSAAHQLGALLSLVEPRIPDGWLERLLISGDSPGPYADHLPADVRRSAEALLAARAQLQQLGAAPSREPGRDIAPSGADCRGRADCRGGVVGVGAPRCAGGKRSAPLGLGAPGRPLAPLNPGDQDSACTTRSPTSRVP